MVSPQAVGNKNLIDKRESQSSVVNQPVKKNDIREIRSKKQLEKVNLDLDSPRMKQALEDLGVSKDELVKK